MIRDIGRSAGRAMVLWVLLWAGLLAGAARADTVTYFHNDIAGTPLAATDEGGNLLWKESYRPYGERLLNQTGPDANRLWFGGKPQDPDTGLSYLGARHYSPQLGRFTGIDPKPVDPEDIHGFNRYAYGNNNPYKFVDPDGKNPVVIFAIARVIAQRLVTFALTRGAQAAITASEVAAGDVLGGASLAAGAAAGAKAIKATGEAATKGMQTFRNLAPADEIVPAVLFPASQVQKVGYSGRLTYVVKESGELVIGRTPHTSLSEGADVLAAGEARFVSGTLRSIDNASGHYRPSGASAQNAAEAAFDRAGFDAAGKYKEKDF